MLLAGDAHIALERPVAVVEVVEAGGVRTIGLHPGLALGDHDVLEDDGVAFVVDLGGRDVDRQLARVLGAAGSEFLSTAAHVSRGCGGIQDQHRGGRAAATRCNSRSHVME